MPFPRRRESKLDVTRGLMSELKKFTNGIFMKTLALILFILLSTTHTYSQSNCNQASLDALINGVNNYRANPSEWKSVDQMEFTLIGANENEKGNITLSINEYLMHSAKETAKKLASINSFNMDHNMNGEGATVRALKDGWYPSFNKLFTADVVPPFTMVLECFEASNAKPHWEEVLDGWKNSTPHNSIILTSGGVSIGCGCETNSSGVTYWVLLIEAEAFILESDVNMDKYFKEGILYKKKESMKGKDLSKYKSYEVYELIK
jgi:uncharacterized protein YkwD